VLDPALPLHEAPCGLAALGGLALGNAGVALDAATLNATAHGRVADLAVLRRGAATQNAADAAPFGVTALACEAAFAGASAQSTAEVLGGVAAAKLALLALGARLDDFLEPVEEGDLALGDPGGPLAVVAAQATLGSNRARDDGAAERRVRALAAHVVLALLHLLAVHDVDMERLGLLELLELLHEKLLAAGLGKVGLRAHVAALPKTAVGTGRMDLVAVLHAVLLHVLDESAGLASEFLADGPMEGHLVARLPVSAHGSLQHAHLHLLVVPQNGVGVLDLATSKVHDRTLGAAMLLCEPTRAQGTVMAEAGAVLVLAGCDHAEETLVGSLALGTLVA